MDRFVVFSDMHFHEWTYGANLVSECSDAAMLGLNDRLYEQWCVTQQIIEFCKQNEVKDVFFCGDLFHKFGLVTAPVMEIAVRMAKSFHSLGINLYCLVGNHDMYSKDGSRHALHCISGYAKIISHPQILEPYEGLPISFLPYTEDKHVLSKFLDKCPGGSLVFLHQGVHNVPMASGYVVNEILSPDMVPDRISMAFTGHYHAHRIVSDKLIVVGAPIQQSFADVGEDMGFLYVDLTQGMITRVKTVARTFHNITKQEDIACVKDGDFVRVIGDVNVDSLGDRNLTVIEKITPPRNIELITNSQVPTIRELVKAYGKKYEQDSSEIIEILEDKHPMLKERYEITPTESK